MNDRKDLDTIIGVMRLGPDCRRLVSPCCRSRVELHGEPAPQYHCECGKVFTSLAQLVIIKGTL